MYKNSRWLWHILVCRGSNVCKSLWPGLMDIEKALYECTHYNYYVLCHNPPQCRQEQTEQLTLYPSTKKWISKSVHCISTLRVWWVTDLARTIVSPLVTVKTLHYLLEPSCLYSSDSRGLEPCPCFHISFEWEQLVFVFVITEFVRASFSWFC